MPFPAAKRAIEEARQKLKREGHEVIEVNYDQKMVERLCDAFLAVAVMNHQERVAEVQGEMIIPEFLVISIISFFPNWIRPLIANVAGLVGQTRVKRMMSIPMIRDTTLLW